MRSSTATTLVEPVSNRRQPVRQTRINPSRSQNGARTLASPDERPKPAPGFFPGITHFTDSITALPKEMIRHYTMLKEVDAKICGPEDALKKLIPATLPHPTAQDSDDDIARRQHFLQSRILMNDMLGSLDEKNHVMSTANDALEKLLARCQSSWPQIEQEISEEARWGSLNHWAYKAERIPEKKGTTITERTRREVAIANNLATAAATAIDAEVAASTRAEARNKSSRKTQLPMANDSDFDEGRGKKNGGGGKRSKPADVSTLNGTGLGITNGTTNGSKRRRVDKPPTSGTIGGQPMEKSLSGVFGNSTRNEGSPRETPAADSSRKRGRGGTLTGNVTGRRRAGTVTSAVNSPTIASSPIVGTFSVPVKGANSPALGTAMQRTSSTRARQNSTQSNSQTNKTALASNHQANGNTSHTNTTEIEKPATNKTTNDAKVAKGEDSNNAETESRTSSRTNDRSLKREDTNSSRPRPPSISTSTRNNGKASKTGTPVAAAFPEPSRPRSGRNNASMSSLEPPIKRSHKKGAGIQAQLAAQAAAAAVAKAQREDDGSSLQGDEEEDIEGEPRYCYCNSVSYGEMVACDMAGCEKEWFHLECAGLARPPTVKTKWYCNDCKKKLR